METTKDNSGGKLENLSDTAFWVAQYRADETNRSDALFNDPLAAKLIQGKGKAIKDFMDKQNKISWPLVIRTYLIDRTVCEYLKDGVDTVLSLAAGLDTRPYRLNVPSNTKWIEVDLPAILEYKDKILTHETSNCPVERIGLDLTDGDARNNFFKRLDQDAANVLVITEGLLVYLDQTEVTRLASDLSQVPSFQTWILDLASPGLVKMMTKQLGDKLESANAPFKFGPKEGPDFFEPFGWVKQEVHSFLKTAASLKRVNLFLRFMALFPESEGRQGSKPWSGVCVYKNKGALGTGK